MGYRVGRFLKDERGTSFEGIALSVSIVAVAFVASADMLDYATKSQDKSAMMAMHKVVMPASMTGRTDLDETSTGSLATSPLPQLVSRSVLDPCTGKIK